MWQSNVCVDKILTHLHQHAQESLLVLIPECGQLLSRREQTAASIHSDFWTVAKVHTEILEDRKTQDDFALLLI